MLRAMPIADRISQYLGLSVAPAVEGYYINPAGPRLPVCDECGAVVTRDSQRRHTEWHARERP